MQPLGNTTNQQITANDCATEVIRTVLIGMQTFRTNMRMMRPQELSVPQFRVLAFLRHAEGASISNVAENFGLSLPSMSRTIDWLVKRGLVLRTLSHTDRRRVALGLTDDGLTVFEETRKATHEQFVRIVSHLTEDEQRSVMDAVKLLQGIFETSNTETRSQNCNPDNSRR